MRVVPVVITGSNPGGLERTLSALAAIKGMGDVVVVNDGHDSVTQSLISSRAGVTVVVGDGRGRVSSVRRGMKRAHEMGADWVWCLDDETVPRPDALDCLTDNLVVQGVGIMAPRHVCGCRVECSEFQWFNLMHCLEGLQESPIARMNVRTTVEVSATRFRGMFVKRDVTDAIGYPDASLRSRYADFDYCIRAIRAGFRLVYVPAAVLDTESRPMSRRERERGLRDERLSSVRDSTWFDRRYGKTWGVRVVRPFRSMAGHAASSLVRWMFDRSCRPGDFMLYIRAWRDGKSC